MKAQFNDDSKKKLSLDNIISIIIITFYYGLTVYKSSIATKKKLPHTHKHKVKF